jgi:hypothetical protein
VCARARVCVCVCVCVCVDAEIEMHVSVFLADICISGYFFYSFVRTQEQRRRPSSSSTASAATRHFFFGTLSEGETKPYGFIVVKLKDKSIDTVHCFLLTFLPTFFNIFLPFFFVGRLTLQITLKR